MHRFILINLLLLVATPSFAFTDGSGWETVTLLKKYMKDFKDFMKVANEHRELAQDVRDLNQKNASSLNVFQNELFKKYIGDFGGTDAAGIAVNGLETFTEIDAAIARIDAEKHKLSPAQKAYWEENREALVYYRKMEAIRRSSVVNLKKSGQDNSERGSGNITANSTASVAAILIEDKEKKKQDDIVKSEIERQQNGSINDLNNSMGAAQGVSANRINVGSDR